MMRSESTRALGHPKLTRPILGGTLLVEGFGMCALIRQARDACLPPCIEYQRRRIGRAVRAEVGVLPHSPSPPLFSCSSLEASIWCPRAPKRRNDARLANELTRHGLGPRNS